MKFASPTRTKSNWWAIGSTQDWLTFEAPPAEAHGARLRFEAEDLARGHGLPIAYS